MTIKARPPVEAGAEIPITWLVKLPHELDPDERRAMLYPPLEPKVRTTREESGAFQFLMGAVAIALATAVVFGLLGSIHKTTERVCPTMDATCQVEQESPS